MADLPPFLELYTSPNRGKTLRADGAPIPAGTTLLTETPLLAFGCNNLELPPTVKEIVSSVRALPAAGRATFDALS